MEYLSKLIEGKCEVKSMLRFTGSVVTGSVVFSDLQKGLVPLTALT